LLWCLTFVAAWPFGVGCGKLMGVERLTC
jgi:hypothetical protein